METGQRRHGVFWLVGGVVGLMLFGCSLALVASLLVMRGETVVQRTGAPRVQMDSSSPQTVALPPTPRPIVLIATPEAGIDYETAVLANIYAEVNPSVVNISVLGSPTSLHSLFPDTRLPNSGDPSDLYRFSAGSGIIWDEAGHVITNNHVVADADEVQVTFADGTTSVARVIGTDVDSDLAVLEVDPAGYSLVPIRHGRLEDVFVGMRVAAIGNPFGLQGSLTTGIVSALGRSIPVRPSFNIPDAIQTDAAINPGNSGGPLLNERGELIGINAQIRSDERANSGVGFAIPISIVERVIPALIANGAYEHPFIGIGAQTYSPICADDLKLPKNSRGALVLNVISGTPAQRAGLRSGARSIDTQYPDICPNASGGDLITAIDNQPVTTFDDVLIYLQRYTSPGDTIRLTVLRDGEPQVLKVTLSNRPR